MSFSSSDIDRCLVDRFKDIFRPSLKFPSSKLDRLALAEALEELAAEVRGEASKRPD